MLNDLRQSKTGFSSYSQSPAQKRRLLYRSRLVQELRRPVDVSYRFESMMLKISPGADGHGSYVMYDFDINTLESLSDQDQDQGYSFWLILADDEELPSLRDLLPLAMFRPWAHNEIGRAALQDSQP
jgi:hypothetical protein